jgi:lipoprotein-anchoring transpeptidase ErfK/SrfK
VINMGQPGYNGRGDLPYPYIAPEPHSRWRAPAYVVNMGQGGYNGRGDLPDTQAGQPLPSPRRTQLAYGGDYTNMVYATGALPAADPAPAATAAFDPRLARQLVDYSGPQKPGTIVINTGERFLYLVQAGGKAFRYGVGVGREGFEWTGTRTIARKAEWPDWHPPAEMLKRRPDLPDYMPGGIRNPLGARAMYLAGTLYRIHGSNEPQSIGHAVSSGCIRMRNEDVIDLYGRVGVGTTVVVM